MATKTKTKPKPELYTWAVNIDGAVTQVTANECMLHQAGIEFILDGIVYRAVAPGHWTTVELVVPDQD